MKFFEREDWSKWEPECICWREPGGSVSLFAGVMVDGRKMYFVQCNTCGRRGSAIRMSALTEDERTAANLVNLAQRRDDTADAYRLANIKREAEREVEREKWWADYDTYLFTTKWRTKRAAVLERDEYTCRACLIAKAAEVHHLTYRHVFNEPLFDLVAVCRQCHESITAIDRQGIPKEYREQIS